MICFKCDRCGEVFDGYKVDGFNGIAKIKTEKNGANIIAGRRTNSALSVLHERTE